MIQVVSKDVKQPGNKLLYQLGCREFTASEIERIIRLDEPAP
jgi:hypothetical protein